MPPNKPLRIAIWNANGLSQHTPEILPFLRLQNVDILLISETHFTDRSHFRVPGYDVYSTQHPDNTAHGGTAIIVRRAIKHHAREEYRQDYLQATSITIQDEKGALNIATVYSPPKHAIGESDYQRFFQTLGQ